MASVSLPVRSDRRVSPSTASPDPSRHTLRVEVRLKGQSLPRGIPRVLVRSGTSGLDSEVVVAKEDNIDEEEEEQPGELPETEMNSIGFHC